MKSIKNILVATDFSSDSDTAVEEAAWLAKKFHSTLYMLDVVDRIEECTADYCMPYNLIAGEKEKFMKDARKKITKKVAEMESKFQIKAVANVRYGDAYEEIMSEEADKHIDLVVIAPHERRTFGGKLFSHLADKIAKNSLCDTLLIRQHA
ncbi:MAG TPA: universal stress protein [Spirochaetota bacterium]|nr:universal stress protein [Spirochaetota bacterium]HPS87931.1 universal stress protein [Spirochaetota bacterium]